MTSKQLWAAVVVVLCGTLSAAYIGYLYPAGGRAGEEVEILIGGQGLGSVRNVILTGGGISGIVCQNVPGLPVPSGSQRRHLYKWVRQIERGDRSFLPLPTGENAMIDWRHSPWFSRLNELTPLQYEITTRFLYVPRNSLQMSPSIAQRVIVRFKIDRNAPPGRRELRLAGYNWVSNPMPFYISGVSEVREPRYSPPPAKKPECAFTPPSVVNGQIMPGETDLFDFEAKKGEVLYFAMKARALQPYLGDGVPGYFQGVMEVTDETGKQLAFADDRHFDPDPVLRFAVPATGRYRLLVRDALYRGREDFVYRIEVDGKPRPWTMLPPPDFAVAPLRIPPENRTVPLTPPTVVEDCLDKPGSRAVWLFSAKKDEKIVADLWARRLGSPVDGLIEICDPSGKRVCVCDDVRRQRIGLVMQHTDPTVIFTAPVSGTYKAVVRDSAGAGGPDHRYYLRIDRPRPDFRAYAAPSALEISNRGIFTVIIERMDGFSGPVTIKLHSPDGFKLCGENTVPAGSCRAVFTLDSMSARRGSLQRVSMTASGGSVTRSVTPGTEAMQAFAYTHLVPCEGDFYVARTGRYWSSYLFRWKEKNPPALKLYPGSKANISIALGKNLPHDFAVSGIALHEQPQGLSVENVKLDIDKRLLTATVSAGTDAKPVTVNQIFVINVSSTDRPRGRKKQSAKPRIIRSSAILPSRRLIVEAPPAKK